MPLYRIVNTDNYGSDYPDEKFVEHLPYMTKEHAEAVAKAINSGLHRESRRYWKAVPSDYKLQPGFEP